MASTKRLERIALVNYLKAVTRLVEEGKLDPQTLVSRWEAVDYLLADIPSSIPASLLTIEITLKRGET